MEKSIQLKLSIMMFLEFFIWGAWFVTMSTYLSKNLMANGIQIGWAYETQSWGAIVAPFIIGLIADRFFAAQRILGVLHILGGILLYFASTSTSFDRFFPLILIYMVLYMPTLALVNSVAFRQMKDTAREFAVIRVLGTIGWIVAGLIIGFIGWEKAGTLQFTFQLAAGTSIFLGVFSFMLPNTPPTNTGRVVSLADILGFEALSLLRDKRYLVFFVSSIMICIPLAFYYQNTNLFLNELGMDAVAAKMTLGQVSEIVFMLLIPVFLYKYGIKKTLSVGMAAWVLRYILFALGDNEGLVWMLVLGIVLHGICYDFFFVSGQIYTDKKAGNHIKSAAQGLITLATYGVGMLIGFRLAGYITNNYESPTGHLWENIWLIPAAIAFVVLMIFVFSFEDESKLLFKNKDND